MIEKQMQINIEQVIGQKPSNEVAKNCVDTSVRLGRVAMEFASIDRVPRFKNGNRETDVEHSYMLALVAPELAVTLELPLDIGLVSQFANVHDLIELKTRDVATFLLSSAQLAQKESDEQSALPQLQEELPAHTGQLLSRYETQAEPEARFVRIVDKLLPLIVNIIGDGTRVMHQDYAISSSEQLRAAHILLQARIKKMFGDEFPDITLAHQILCELFEHAFNKP